MPVRLLVRSKAETGATPPQEVLLTGDQLTLGREKGCSVVLNDPSVSRNHAQIVREGALYFLEDLGSSFGTRVNAATLPAAEKRLLRNGDVIAIGPYDVTFDRVADVAATANDEKTSYVARRVVKDALRGLASGAGPYLRVMNGPLEGKRFEIHELQELVLGREEGVDVRLNDDLTSRRHAKIRRDWAGTHVEDLDSRNGIKVNKKRVTEQSLKDRDELEIGSTRFLYLDPSEVRETAVLPEQESPAPERAAPSAPLREERAPEPEQHGEPEPHAAAEEPHEESEPAEPPEQDHEENAADADAQDAHGEIVPVDEPAAVESPNEGRVRARLPVPALPGGWRNMVPVLVVVGVAVCAIAVLAVTFFVM